MAQKDTGMRRMWRVALLRFNYCLAQSKKLLFGAIKESSCKWARALEDLRSQHGLPEARLQERSIPRWQHKRVACRRNFQYNKNWTLGRV